jgi:hypothetical protein
MNDNKNKPTVHQRWAHLRFSVVGPLLAAPPPHGQLQEQLEKLAAKEWLHPATGEPAHFGLSTIQRWLYQAKGETTDPVGALRRKVRKDLGQQPSLGDKLKAALLAQYAVHKSWSYQLHADNLTALVEADSKLGPMPSYSTVRRYMKATGLFKRRRLSSKETAGALKAEERLDTREVRSYESEFVGGLGHLDFHQGSLPVLTPAGDYVLPQLFGMLDDRSSVALRAHGRGSLHRGCHGAPVPEGRSARAPMVERRNSGTPRRPRGSGCAPGPGKRAEIAPDAALDRYRPLAAAPGSGRWS